jgi:hypothetical protein
LFQLKTKNSKLKTLIALFLISLSSPAFSEDRVLTGPSNWGVTGLMETPTARIMNENSYRFGAGQAYPYRYYYGTLGLFDGLEINGRVTEVIGVKALSSSYGNTKDKAFDLKYRLWTEGKYSPAVALGIMDPHGTRLYSGQFLVASKQIYPFDFTVGFGNGRFGNTPLTNTGNDLFQAEILTDTRQWLKDGQFFGGVQFSPSEKYSFMVEYNPTEYQKQTGDPAQPKYFTRPVSSPFNVGFRWRPFRWAEIDLTYQRGNEIGINLVTTFDIGNPLIPIYDKPYREKPRMATLALDERIATALLAQGFSDVGIDQSGDTLLIVAQNDKYFYSMRAMGVIFKAISSYLAPSVENVRIVLTQTGIPVMELATTRADIQDFEAERLTTDEIFYLSHIDTGVARAPAIPTKDWKYVTYGARPSFQTFLNDPSGFFKYRFGAEGWMAYHPWKGVSFVGSVEAYPLNTISSSNVPTAQAVRSDIWEYQQQNLSLGRLMIDQIWKPRESVYYRFAAGLLEIEYAGVDSEVAKPLANGRFLVGLQASLLKKRDPNNPVALKDYSVKDYYDVEFFNTQLNVPEMELSLNLKTGRFLGSDFGTRATLTKYVKGVSLSFWYTFTDTSVFRDRFNRGYHDTGVAVSIPLRLFEGTDSRTSYSFAVTPWTRDVGQDIDRYRNLFDYIGRDVKVFLQQDKKMLE